MTLSDLTAKAESFLHIPVLPQAVIEGLAIRAGGQYLDATVGGGGHSRLILQSAPEIQLTALDQDEMALAAARANLAEFGDRAQFYHTNFSRFQPAVLFDGVIADLGVSSAQLDIAERGFSFRQEAPLDMRMNQQQDLTAEAVINHWDEVALADIFYHYGEERLSRKIARRICDRRPFQTTTELADTIFHSVPRSYRYGRIHPATRVFQALRIAVNCELEVLDTLLREAPNWLKPGGRLAIISFHSLEDRRVKNAFRESELLKIVTKKPIIATEEEIRENGRSRSAKLRVAERI
jgi:16S rRNA (cytosine1402-N4)-methyltransferase